MKLHNPFTARNEDIRFSAGISIVIIFGFCLGWLISKVGFLAFGIGMLTVISVFMVLAPFFVALKYIFTGKE